MKTRELKIDCYDTFQCSADQCPITCCQEWKIEVDDDTYQKWNSVKVNDDGNKTLTSDLRSCDGQKVISLNEQRQCPYLNQKKLCSLVLKHGDHILSHTCATFPREVHQFTDRTEYSLSACCPEVVDWMNRQEKIGFTRTMQPFSEDYLYQIRTLMIELIQEKGYDPSKSLRIIFYMLLDLKRKGTSRVEDFEEYKKESTQKELSDAIDQMPCSKAAMLEEQNELFLDLAQSYREQKMYAAWLEPIAELSDKLSDHLDEEKMLSCLQQFEAQFLGFQKLMQNFLVSEVFNISLMPDSDRNSMIVMTQWIAMEYAMIKHAIFLQWMLEPSTQLTYESVRESMVIIARMTGYESDGICEYLKDNFQSIYWEWGYLALIV